MDISKKIVNQDKFKITQSGTFTIEAKDIIASPRFRNLVQTLKPVSELKTKK